MFSICSYVAETDEAINLVEGEKVYIIGKFFTYYPKLFVDVININLQ